MGATLKVKPNCCNSILNGSKVEVPVEPPVAYIPSRLQQTWTSNTYLHKLLRGGSTPVGPFPVLSSSYHRGRCWDGWRLAPRSVPGIPHSEAEAAPAPHQRPNCVLARSCGDRWCQERATHSSGLTRTVSAGHSHTQGPQEPWVSVRLLERPPLAGRRPSTATRADKDATGGPQTYVPHPHCAGKKSNIDPGGR